MSEQVAGGCTLSTCQRFGARTSEAVRGASVSSVHDSAGAPGRPPGHSLAVVEGLTRRSEARGRVLVPSGRGQDGILGLKATNNWSTRKQEVASLIY